MKASRRARKNIGGDKAKGPLERLAEYRRLLRDTESGLESLGVLLDLLEENGETLTGVSVALASSIPPTLSNEIAIVRGRDEQVGYFQLSAHNHAGVAWQISKRQNKDGEWDYHGSIHPIWNGAVWNETRSGASIPIVPTGLASIGAGDELVSAVNDVNRFDKPLLPPDSAYLSDYAPDVVLAAWRCAVVIKAFQADGLAGSDYADAYVDVPISTVMRQLRKWDGKHPFRIMFPPAKTGIGGAFGVVWKPSDRERKNPGGVGAPTHEISIDQVRRTLAARTERCSPDCPGWAIFEVDRPPWMEIEACDECNIAARETGHPKVWDDDVEILPEAQAELARQRGEVFDNDFEQPEPEPAAPNRGPNKKKNPRGGEALSDEEILVRFRELLLDPNPSSLQIAQDLLLEHGKTLPWASNHIWREEEIASSGIGAVGYGALREIETHSVKVYMAGFFPLAEHQSTAVAWYLLTVHHPDPRVVEYAPMMYLSYRGTQWAETTAGPSMPIGEGHRQATRDIVDQLAEDGDFLPVPVGANRRVGLLDDLVKVAWETCATLKRRLYGSGSPPLAFPAEGEIDEVLREIRSFEEGDTPPHELLRGGALVGPGDLKENPAWVTHTLADAFESLASQVPPQWLPKLDNVRGGPKATLVATLKEYGCGAYGCVLPTLDPATVLKVTTDFTEAEFASQLAADLVAPICVEYYMAVSLAARHEGRPIYLLWRESADDVGEVDKVIGVDAAYYIDEQHKAAQTAYKSLHDKADDATTRRLLREWEIACHEMGQAVPELRTLADGLVKIYREQKIFMGDIHAGNLGRVFRGDEIGAWVVTDPGHVAVL